MRSLVFVGLALASLPGWPQGQCTHRGDLSPIYCDEDRDLIADAPKEKSKWRNPATLMLSYSPQEDTAAYEKLWAPYVAHLSRCVGRPTKFLQVFSSAAAIEALRSGRIQFSLLATGDTPFAVNVGGAVPYAGIGNEKSLLGYHVVVLVKHDSPYKLLTDLKGKRVAHTAPSSNSGNMAPRALFPALGLTPDKDYKVIFSGKHDQSILGVNSGDYDAAAVASDVFERMIDRGVIKADDFRTIYRSEKFPTQDFAYAHDLEPKFRDQMLKCFYDYRFTDELKKAFAGADRFYPINYLKDFELIRSVAHTAGETFSRAAYEKQQAATKK